MSTTTTPQISELKPSDAAHALRECLAIELGKLPKWQGLSEEDGDDLLFREVRSLKRRSDAMAKTIQRLIQKRS